MHCVYFALIHFYTSCQLSTVLWHRSHSCTSCFLARAVTLRVFTVNLAVILALTLTLTQTLILTLTLTLTQILILTLTLIPTLTKTLTLTLTLTSCKKNARVNVILRVKKSLCKSDARPKLTRYQVFTPIPCFCYSKQFFEEIFVFVLKSSHVAI